MRKEKERRDFDLDMVLTFCQEVKTGQGEDNFCHLVDEEDQVALAAVFDGCGGLGSRVYEDCSNHTGAYMASRVASGAVCDWFQDKKYQGNNLEETLRFYLQERFDFCKQFARNEMQFKGSLVRDLPTTAAIAMAKYNTSGMILHLFWAGDSRVYMLNRKGLGQLTQDDLYGQDAMSNLFEDGALTNVISADGKYEIHHKKLKITSPCMIFAATDGCFGYLPTPMEFEYVILESLQNSRSPQEFRDILSQKIAGVAGDDSSMSMMIFGYHSFKNMQQALFQRYTDMKDEYIARLRMDNSKEMAMSLWQVYRTDYERLLKDKHRKM